MKALITHTPEDFKKAIQIDEYAIGALLLLYSYQTTDEQIARGTKHQNGQGFNSTDGLFCSSLASQYQTRGRLTEKQLASLKKLLPKYHNQVQVVEPYANLKPEPKTEIPKIAKLSGETLIVSFPYDQQTVDRVKELSGRKWNKEQKQWEVPLHAEAVQELTEIGFSFEFKPGDNLEKIILELSGKITKEEKSIDKIPGLRIDLYPYQRDGISFIDKKKGRALIGDEMGLGKTIQALGWLQLRRKTSLPAIVVCPASLKLNWAREALKFTDLEPVIINGRDKKEFITFPGGNRQDIYIINYDVLHGKEDCPSCEGKKSVHGIKCKKCNGKGSVPILHPELKKLGIKTAIYDEVHYCKTNGTGRTVAAQELSKQAEFVITLSGTPITNRPVEFYNAIQMVNSRIFPSWWKFTGRYCGRKHTGFGWDTSGASNTQELHEKLVKSIMLRRLKKDVLTQLPPKVRTVVPMEINLRKYETIMNDIRKQLEESDNQAQHLTIIEKAKQAVVGLKMDMALEWIQDYIDNDQKLVVFAEHREVIDHVFDHFKSIAVRIYGGTSQKERQAAVDRFQTDATCKLFIGSKAAKEGLTLTAASSTATLELWWVPGDHDQAEDRVHRIGQEADSVTAYYLLAAGTIEEDIASLLDEKRKVITSVLDGIEVQEKSLLTALMKKIMEDK